MPTQRLQHIINTVHAKDTRLIMLKLRIKFCLFYIICNVLFLTVACDHPYPKEDEIVGKWKSEDGATIEFTNSKSVYIKNLPISMFTPFEDGMFSGEGGWEFSFENKVSPWQMINVYAKNSTTSVGNELVIERENYVTGGGEIEYLFVWIGDPDSEERYKFYKISR